MRDVSWEDIFGLGASAAAIEFCEWVQVEIYVYIPHQKYQVKPQSSLWFSAACAAAILHRNHSFRLYQQSKSSESSDRLVMVIKGFLNLPNLHMLIKQKRPSLLVTGLLVNCYANSVLNKGKSQQSYISSFQRPGGVVFFHLIKQNCMLKRTLIVMTEVSLYCFPF